MDLCSRRYGKSYSPFALVAFHSRIHMVVRSGQVLVVYSQLFKEEGAVQWWQAFRCVQQQLGAKEGAVQWWQALRCVQQPLGAEEGAVQWWQALRCVQQQLGAKEGAVQWLQALRWVAEECQHVLLGCTHHIHPTYAATFAVL